jgi:SAM-dependent methyltransferase
VALACSVGSEGRVWAIDIQKAVLEIIRSKARTEHLLNIEYVWADLEEPGRSGLAERFMDFVLIGNILFQAARRDIVLREAWRILREAGRLAVIEWDVPMPKLSRALEIPEIPENSPAIAQAGNFQEFQDGAGLEDRHGNVGNGTVGPPHEVRVKKEDARALAVQAGFEYDREFAAGPHHYGLLFIKR